MNTVTVNSKVLRNAIERSNYGELKNLGATPRVSDLWFSCPNCFNRPFPVEEMFLLQESEESILVQNLTTFFEFKGNDGQIEGLDKQFFHSNDEELELLCKGCVERIGIDVSDIDVYTLEVGDIH